MLAGGGGGLDLYQRLRAAGGIPRPARQLPSPLLPLPSPRLPLSRFLAPCPPPLLPLLLVRCYPILPVLLVPCPHPPARCLVPCDHLFCTFPWFAVSLCDSYLHPATAHIFFFLAILSIILLCCYIHFSDDLKNMLKIATRTVRLLFSGVLDECLRNIAAWRLWLSACHGLRGIVVGCLLY